MTKYKNAKIVAIDALVDRKRLPHLVLAVLDA